jgi:hypothetical protein
MKFQAAGAGVSQQSVPRSPHALGIPRRDHLQTSRGMTERPQASTQASSRQREKKRRTPNAHHVAGSMVHASALKVLCSLAELLAEAPQRRVVARRRRGLPPEWSDAQPKYALHSGHVAVSRPIYSCDSNYRRDVTRECRGGNQGIIRPHGRVRSFLSAHEGNAERQRHEVAGTRHVQCARLQPAWNDGTCSGVP